MEEYNEAAAQKRSEEKILFNWGYACNGNVMQFCNSRNETERSDRFQRARKERIVNCESVLGFMARISTNTTLTTYSFFHHHRFGCCVFFLRPPSSNILQSCERAGWRNVMHILESRKLTSGEYNIYKN